LRLAEPSADVALDWLSTQGVGPKDDAQVLLTACSGRPLDALAWSKAGLDANSWAALPEAVARGQSSAVSGWPVPRVVDALQKLCHDALSRAAGGPAAYYPDARVPAHGQLAALAEWSRELQRVARHDEHPWNEGLLIDSLVQGGARALTPATAGLPKPSRGLDTLTP
jgi:DNA polymerase-3 subunit delta'